ncbi:MAG: hypothetical protein IPQ07_08225 [Myxococcales bacterium]|nr:hypothetical protein [Myxococcales bacterium]
MRPFTILAISALCAAPLIAACGSSGSDAEPYDTLQACFDDHHNVEALAVQESIVICCLEHPIAGVKPACGTTATACAAFVDANLDTTVTTADITPACADYISQLGM